VPRGLAPLWRGAAAAIEAGDLALKPAQTLYLHRVAGVKAPRVVFGAAADGSAKALRKAVAAPAWRLKGAVRSTLAVALAAPTRRRRTPRPWRWRPPTPRLRLPPHQAQRAGSGPSLKQREPAVRRQGQAGHAGRRPARGRPSPPA
jgi:hypothetical protein